MLLLLAILCCSRATADGDTRISPVKDAAKHLPLVPTDLSLYRFMLTPENDRPYTMQELLARTPKVVLEADSYPRKTSGINGDSDVPQPAALACSCSDIDPRINSDGPVYPTRCRQQAAAGACGQPFMLDTALEAPEGYCQISCSRCTCCGTFMTRLKELGFTEFAAAAAAVGLDSLLSQPGLESTIFVPDDDAMRRAFADYGRPGPNRTAAFWQSTILYHMAPPLNPYQALWTTPFLEDGLSLTTELHQIGAMRGIKSALPKLRVSKTRGLRIIGARSGAAVPAVDSIVDAEVCKGYVIGVDSVLLPYAPGRDEPYLLPLDLPAQECSGEFGANYAGDIIPVQGQNTTTALTAADCCRQCWATTGCNVWVYCPSPSGCGIYDRFAQGSCTLKAQTGLAAGMASVWERGIEVPWVSGTVQPRL